MGKAGTRRYFESLDALRGLAALAVALYHVSWTHPLQNLPFVRHAEFMVDFFFVLSGFCIAHVYGNRLLGGADLRRYLYLRFWRLYPLHFFFLLIFIGIELIKLFAVASYGLDANVPPFQPGWPGILLGNVLLVHSLGFFDRLAFNVPSWSISTEFYTYLVYGVFALWLPMLRQRFWVAVAVIASCLVTLAVFNDGSLINDAARFGFVRCLAGFFTGMLVHMIHSRAQMADVRAFSGSQNFLSVALLLLCGWLPGGLAGKGVFEFLALPAFGLLILSLLAGENTALHRYLCLGPLRWLGRVSYSVYLSHLAILFGFSQLLRFVFDAPTEGESATELVYLVDPLTGSALLISYIVAVLLVSCMTYAGIEEPFRRRAKMRVSGTKQEQP